MNFFLHRLRTESDCNDIVLGKLFYIRRFVQTFRILEITKQTIWKQWIRHFSLSSSKYQQYGMSPVFTLIHFEGQRPLIFHQDRTFAVRLPNDPNPAINSRMRKRFASHSLKKSVELQRNSGVATKTVEKNNTAVEWLGRTKSSVWTVDRVHEAQSRARSIGIGRWSN